MRAGHMASKRALRSDADVKGRNEAQRIANGVPGEPVAPTIGRGANT